VYSRTTVGTIHPRGLQRPAACGGTQPSLATRMTAKTQLTTLALVLALALVSGAGKPSAYTTCDSCVAAGFGWSKKKGKCGGFANKVCASPPPPSPPPTSPPPPTPKKAPRGPAPSPAPSMLAELTDENFDEMVASSDIWLVQFSGSACPECDAMRGAMERAAVQLRSAPFKMGIVDAVQQPGVASDFGVKIWPAVMLFRGGDLIEKFPGPDTADGIVSYLSKVATQPSGGLLDDVEEPEIVKFRMETAQSLMKHRLKVQLVVFSKSGRGAEKQVQALTQGIKKGRLSRAVLGLHVPTDVPQNRPVLDRFFVQDTLPALRIAVMYPDGSGLRVLAPPGGGVGRLADGKPKQAEDIVAVLKAHFNGDSKPLLRSQPKPGLSHAVITDLVGSNVDDWLMTPDKNTLLLMYWDNCEHCETLMPVFE
jgi:hypothetical protein